MIRLYLAEIRSNSKIPDFGPAFAAHICKKKNPRVRDASITAWRLLRFALDEAGIYAPGNVVFTETGKPYLPDGPHFSLSHSYSLAAALISDAPCGVDIEMIDARIAQKLAPRCLSANEADRDFFECWTRKECLAKLDGRGLFSHPEHIDTAAPELTGRFFTERVFDNIGRTYVLSALGENANCIRIAFPESYQ